MTTTSSALCVVILLHHALHSIIICVGRSLWRCGKVWCCFWSLANHNINYSALEPWCEDLSHLNPSPPQDDPKATGVKPEPSSNRCEANPTQTSANPKVILYKPNPIQDERKPGWQGWQDASKPQDQAECSRSGKWARPARS